MGRFYTIRCLVCTLVVLGAGAGDDVCSSSASAVYGGSCAANALACASAKECEHASALNGLRFTLVDAEANLTSQGPPAKVLSSRVFYGRPLSRIPRGAILSLDTITDRQLAAELTDRLPALLGKPSRTSMDSAKSGFAGMFAGDRRLWLTLTFALLSERRSTESSFQPWLDAVKNVVPPLILQLTERQLQALAGTSVEGVRGDLDESLRLIMDLSSNFTSFHDEPLDRTEVLWVFGVIARHAHPIALASGLGFLPGGLPPCLILLPGLVSVRWHPDPSVAIPFREGSAPPAGNDARHEVGGLVQTARRDMRVGEEVLFWDGRFSNSELAVLGRGSMGKVRNPTGVGGRLDLPKNWSPNPNTPHSREYKKYNCSSPAIFEIRISPKGWPNRGFVRCRRVAHHLARGDYKAEFFMERIHALDKWPPPSKWDHQDWLSWTQADQDVNKEIQEYCEEMKRRLKDTMTSAIAEDFRLSSDPVDKILWRLRVEESNAYKECVALARSISNTATR